MARFVLDWLIGFDKRLAQPHGTLRSYGDRGMKTRGVKVLDPALQTRQLDWLVLSIEECPNHSAEQHVILTHFRVPHEPWGPGQAFVSAVHIRRTRFRVLFRQESGVGL